MRTFATLAMVLMLSAVGTALSKAAEKPAKGGKTGGPPKELTVDLGDGVKMEFVLIGAGQFMMGSRESAEELAKRMKDGKADLFKNERPAHKVTITKPFFLGKYEVTQGQWQAVMANDLSWFAGPKNPVEEVSWTDCQKYMAKLNEKLRAAGAKFSLPTEAQWEYACRAGTTTQFDFSDDPAKLDEYAWRRDNAKRTTHPVGQKKPNAWGLYDMYGNVWEWTADWYAEDYYGKSPAVDPAGPDSGESRVLRGGSWYYGGSGFFRCAYRGLNCPPDYRSDDYGFRVVRTVAP